MTIAIHIPDYHMTQRKEVVRWLALPGIGIVTLTQSHQGDVCHRGSLYPA